MLELVLFLLPALSLVFQANPISALRSSNVHQLISRQSPYNNDSTPAQCHNRCSIINAAFNGCAGPGAPTVPGCGCSSNTETGLVDCLNCILDAGENPPTQGSIDLLQSAVNRYVVECAADGVVLPETAVSGGTFNATAPPLSQPSTASAILTTPNTSHSTRTGSGITAFTPGIGTSTSTSPSTSASAGTSNGTTPTNAPQGNDAEKRTDVRSTTIIAAAAAVLVVFF